MTKFLTKFLILLILVSQESNAICLKENKPSIIHIKVESCKLVNFEDFPELKKAEVYLKSENRIDDLNRLKKDYEGVVIYYLGEPYFYKTEEKNACEKYLPNSESDFIQKYPCCDILPRAAGDVPCGIGENSASIQPVNK